MYSLCDHTLGLDMILIPVGTISIKSALLDGLFLVE